MRNYHEKDANTCAELGTIITESKFIAVLDGQQRLIALNIGVTGSRAHKLPNKRRDNIAAYPATFLHLDLIAEEDDLEEGMENAFRFLTLEKAKYDNNEGAERLWFRVSDILNIQEGFGIFNYIQNANLSKERATQAYNRLDALHRLVHKTPLVSCYTERNQDLERVLKIFIRMNSGGSILSKSDLLFSTAVANWTIDARKEINELASSLNSTAGGFNFSKDFILKAGLMLAEIQSVGFKVDNFNRTNMRALEQAWPGIKEALSLTVRLIASFGFTGKTLRADSALLPVAFYIYSRKLSDEYLTTSKHLEDRRSIRRWLIKSYLKASGIWGSGLDTLLTALRQVISSDGQNNFPVESIESVMSRRGKSLVFTEAEIEDLIDLRYGTDRTFSLLSLLFETVDTTKEVHVDHIFPISRFTNAKLAAEGVPEVDRQTWHDRANSLPNLQLLEGAINLEKLEKLPLDWLTHREPDELQRQRYLLVHDLGDMPSKLEGCPEFWSARRARLLNRLIAILGLSREETSSYSSSHTPDMPSFPLEQDINSDQNVADLPCNAQNYDALLEMAQQGILPGLPDFTAQTHAYYRPKLADLEALAKSGKLEALKSYEILGPNATIESSSPRMMQRYRNLCVIALEAKGNEAGRKAITL